jgi:hypothetical protein
MPDAPPEITAVASERKTSGIVFAVDLLCEELKSMSDAQIEALYASDV